MDAEGIEMLYIQYVQMKQAHGHRHQVHYKSFAFIFYASLSIGEKEEDMRCFTVVGKGIFIIDLKRLKVKSSIKITKWLQQKRL